MSYICTGYSNEHVWSYGERRITHTFSLLDNKVTVGTIGCCWITGSRDWNVSTTFSLTSRSDIGQINSSPHVMGFPYLRIQQGYYYTIPLAVHDPDNDRIQCRWAVGSECADICNSFYGAVLDPDSCTIWYYANNETGSIVVAIVVEDFLPNTLQPLSSVSHQFAVDIVSQSASQSCPSPIPRFIAPIHSHGDCIMIPSGGYFVEQIVATSGCSNIAVTSIQVIGPIGINTGQLQHVPGTNNYYINVTWIPTADQQNDTHFLCFVAINSQSLTSEQSCIKLVAGYHPPTPLRESATPNHQLVYPSNNLFKIVFDRSIQRPSTSAFIRFFKSGEEMYHINVLLSQEVAYFKSTLTIVPYFTFTERDTYYINFDRGVVQSVDFIEGCQLPNEPILNETFWTFEVARVVPGKKI